MKDFWLDDDSFDEKDNHSVSHNTSYGAITTSLVEENECLQLSTFYTLRLEESLIVLNLTPHVKKCVQFFQERSTLWQKGWTSIRDDTPWILASSLSTRCVPKRKVMQQVVPTWRGRRLMSCQVDTCWEPGQLLSSCTKTMRVKWSIHQPKNFMRSSLKIAQLQFVCQARELSYCCRKSTKRWVVDALATIAALLCLPSCS